MIRVDDLDDPRLSNYRFVAQPAELERRGWLVAEGRLVLPRLLDAPRIRTQSILLSTVAWQAMQPALDARRFDAPIYVAPQEALSAVVGFNMHRGCLALAERPTLPTLTDVDLRACPRVLVLEGVNNPDNIGGLFRNAAAFGVDLVVLGPRCSDPFYRKAIRTSMGATLHVPIASAGPWPDAIDRLRAAGLQTIALTPSPEATPLKSIAASTSGIALLLGAEGDGLSGDALRATDVRVRIEMVPSVNSLNVATAAAIALHHFLARKAGAARDCT